MTEKHHFPFNFFYRKLLVKDLVDLLGEIGVVREPSPKGGQQPMPMDTRVPVKTTCKLKLKVNKIHETLKIKSIAGIKLQVNSQETT